MSSGDALLAAYRRKLTMTFERNSVHAWALVLVLLATPAWADKDADSKDPQLGRQETRATVRMPETHEIPPHGIARNFELVGWNPLLDGDRGGANRDRAFDPYVNPPLNFPRGSNGDITPAGDCVYVGSFVGYHSTVIVDVSRPHRPTVVGEVP